MNIVKKMWIMVLFLFQTNACKNLYIDRDKPIHIMKTLVVLCLIVTAVKTDGLQSFVDFIQVTYLLYKIKVITMANELTISWPFAHDLSSCAISLKKM